MVAPARDVHPGAWRGPVVAGNSLEPRCHTSKERSDCEAETTPEKVCAGSAAGQLITPGLQHALRRVLRGCSTTSPPPGYARRVYSLDHLLSSAR